jgi:pyruvate,water dikinase
MTYVLPLDQIRAEHRSKAGGKAYALAELTTAGLRVPAGLAVTTGAYDDYVSRTGVRERVLLELNWKPFSEMRWEEMWDAALRIRNMFLTTALPMELEDALRAEIGERFADIPVVVRSSAPGEDSATASFAGLHESYVNVVGADAIVDHVRLVWASLWSDRALLYRQELNLDVQRSTMAVLIQEIICGDKSGVVFGQSPADPEQAVIEAVHGLNQGLVDGTVEPDRWEVARATGQITSHTPAQRESAVAPAETGVSLVLLPAERTAVPPLSESEVGQVYRLARQSEDHFGSPQDVEWTYLQRTLYALQSRPITSAAGDGKDDKRSWYLSLTRSLDNLRQLRRRIEEKLIPAMDEHAAELSEQDLGRLSDAELGDAIERRAAAYEDWKATYWDEFIPFAHGARLFGQVYNDALRPADPFEFTRLLGATDMISLRRNAALEHMASLVRQNAGLEETLRTGDLDALGDEFNAALEDFVRRFSIVPGRASERETIAGLVAAMARRDSAGSRLTAHSVSKLAEDFLSHFEGERRDHAEELLDLGRASYRLRDNDNIHLKAIEDEGLRAAAEGRKRLANRLDEDVADWEPSDVAATLRDPLHRPASGRAGPEKSTDYALSPRQLTGQPAGPGIAAGKARVVSVSDDLFRVSPDEILVCDAVDPNMTFVVPLVAGIVERRGGMLIHGAIIAREYGLPCVTGVTNATNLIQTGDSVTVDGYLGIVTVSGREGTL